MPRVLAVSDVTAENDRGLPALRGVSLDVAAGEIVGIAAVAGNGQSELAQVITGLRACGGSVTVNGEEVANRPAGHAIRHGVAHVPEDRTGVGTSPNLSITDNLIMKRYRDAPVARGWFIDDAAARALAQGLKDEYAIAAPSIDTQARLLSGGNLQRLIIAREIESGPRLMVAVQPTRGLDVGAIEAVHRVLLDPARGGDGDPAHLGGPRRDPRPGRSDRRPVRGPDGRLVRGRRRGHPRDRAADDRWRARSRLSPRTRPPGRRAGEPLARAPDGRAALAGERPDDRRVRRSPSSSAR